MLGPTLGNTEFLLYEGRSRHRELLDRARQIRTPRRSMIHRSHPLCRLLIGLGRWLMETGMRFHERADRSLILQAHNR